MAQLPRAGGSYPGGGPIRLPPFAVALLLVPALLVIGFGYWWFVQRIEVGPDELCVLVRKVGSSLPDAASDQVILHPALLSQLGVAKGDPTGGYKGVVYEPLQPGRYFYDPLFWQRVPIPITIIKQDEVGILIRRYGKPLGGAGPLEGGRTIAEAPDERGPVREVLKPGRHPINTRAYDVQRVPPVTIPAGCVGVQTLFAGKPPSEPNVYIVREGEAGVQPKVLPPGLYYNNPYERRIDIIDVRSHTLDLRESGAIEFPSNDSFTIQVEATVEYAIRQDKAPYVMVAIGEHAHVVNRIILPYMNSLARIEGSKLYARDFIAGETRTAFQNRVFEQLRKNCDDQGIEIRAALIRRIVVPDAIAGPISDRQSAEQQLNAALSEIKVAQAEAKLVEQEEMQKQNQALGEANRANVTRVKEAEQLKSVALTDAQKRLEVARLRLRAAEEKAAAVVSLGQVEADVARLEYQSKARPLAEAIGAFGDGDAYAQFFFYQKLSPALKHIQDSTAGPLAEIFRALGPARPPGRREPAAAERASRDVDSAPSAAGDMP